MRLLESLLELLYPPRCAFCRKLLPAGAGVCRDCQKSLPYTQGVSQEQRFPYVPRCISPMYYDGAVRESILRYKFHGLACYGKVYGEIMAKCIDEKQISCDIITWVPLSRRRKRSRGYDQAQLIARQISGILGLDCVPCLKKLRNNPAQSGTGSAKKRRENVEGIYAPLCPEQIQGKHILLVDDVVTTGATLSQCAKVLTKAGAAKVTAVSLARNRR